VIKKGLLVVAALAAGCALYLLYLLYSWGEFKTAVYDTVPPDFSQIVRPAVLVLHKTNGYVHEESLPAATELLAEIAQENGWSVYQTDNAASHNVNDLARFDVVVWNNTSGDILTIEQRDAFKGWMVGGGQWLGLHAAGGDPSYEWNWYVEQFLRAQFVGHTMSPHLQDADVLRVDDSSLTAHFPERGSIAQEEWYGFDRNPRDHGSSILLALDESTYDTSETVWPDSSMPGEHPIAWTHRIGKGRMIYSAIGHKAYTYTLPEYRLFLVKAIASMIDVDQ
jgi:type 1 glutamine amidotransferase